MSHDEVAEALIWLLTVHKMKHPRCKSNCFDKVVEDIKRKAK